MLTNQNLIQLQTIHRIETASNVLKMNKLSWNRVYYTFRGFERKITRTRFLIFQYYNARSTVTYDSNLSSVSSIYFSTPTIDTLKNIQIFIIITTFDKCLLSYSSLCSMRLLLYISFIIEISFRAWKVFKTFVYRLILYLTVRTGFRKNIYEKI